MDLGIGGKVAMVAASSKGIGLAVAEELAREGCLVSMCARSQDGLDRALESVPNAMGFVCDVSQAEALVNWFEESESKLGPVEILVSNTGGPPAGKWTELTDEQWQEGFDSTLMNIIRLVRLVTPSMRKKGWGRIVHITSLVAKQPYDILPISSTLRAGIDSLTRLQSDELIKNGITVNSVLPGHTHTDRQVHLAEFRAEQAGITVEEALVKAGEETPIGRLARPDEIAAAVAFLCSERASYISGANLLVDGGVVRGPG